MRFAGEITFALVFDGGEIAGRRLDEPVVGELYVGRSVPNPVDPQLGKRDEVLFDLPSRRRIRQDGVADLLDEDRTRGERRLLRVVSLKCEVLGTVGDVVSRDGRVVGHLFDEQVRLPAAVLVRPGAIEQLS